MTSIYGVLCLTCEYVRDAPIASPNYRGVNGSKKSVADAWHELVLASAAVHACNRSVQRFA
jgi:hypothetical protein